MDPGALSRAYGSWTVVFCSQTFTYRTQRLQKMPRNNEMIKFEHLGVLQGKPIQRYSAYPVGLQKRMSLVMQWKTIEAISCQYLYPIISISVIVEIALEDGWLYTFSLRLLDSSTFGLSRADLSQPWFEQSVPVLIEMSSAFPCPSSDAYLSLIRTFHWNSSSHELDPSPQSFGITCKLIRIR